MFIEAVTKALLYAAVLETIGAAVSLWIVTAPVVEPSRDSAEVLVRRIGVATSIGVVVALMLRGWSHTAATFDLPSSMTREALSTVLISSRWGHSWRLQLLAGFGCLVAFAAASRRRLRPAPTIAAAALAVAITTTGHAAGSSLHMAVHTAHVLGAGMWLGTLATLVVVGGIATPERRRGMFRAFSGIALTGAAVVAAAGVIASWWYVGTVENLWSTRYGQVLLAKLAMVGGVIVCGYVNWRGIGAGRSGPGRVGAIELLLAGAVIAATGLLTELEHP